jgi:hypothetical protein
VSFVFAICRCSFPVCCGRGVRRARPLGLLVVLAPAILAGCGGSAKSNVQTVRGNGYRFTAPATWTVLHKGASTSASRGLDLVEVTHFTLEKPYRVARFASVSRELDSVAAGLARQSAGRLEERATRKVGGRKTRYYRISYGTKVEETAFVLSGLDEYEVLCRRAAKAPDATCARLFSSFKLG